MGQWNLCQISAPVDSLSLIFKDSLLTLHPEATMTEKKLRDQPTASLTSLQCLKFLYRSRHFQKTPPGVVWDDVIYVAEIQYLNEQEPCSTSKWFKTWAPLNSSIYYTNLLTQQSPTNTSMVTLMALSGLYSGNNYWRQTTDWTLTRLSFPLGSKSTTSRK